MAAQYKFLLPTQECLFKKCVQEDTDLQAPGMLRTAHSALDKLWIKFPHLELKFNYHRKPAFAQLGE